MESQIEVHFLAENNKNNLVTYLTEKLMQQDFSNSIIPYIENETTVINGTGDILLVSLAFIPKIKLLNKLTSQYSYINFIHPLAYSQFDEKRLFSQIISINEGIQTNIIKKEKREQWTFSDYLNEMNISYI